MAGTTIGALDVVDEGDEEPEPPPPPPPVEEPPAVDWTALMATATAAQEAVDAAAVAVSELLAQLAEAAVSGKEQRDVE